MPLDLPRSVRTDWTREEIAGLFDLPFSELLFRAANIHRETFDPTEIEAAQLLSIKTGGCPEDCGYCSQSAKFDTGLKASKLMATDEVLADAKRAKENGATRFCMGAAWRSPKERDMPALTEMIRGVKEMGLETCMTLGMLTETQAVALKEAGLDFYNHNIDTSEEHYSEVITTRTFKDRLETLEAVRKSGMQTCCGGILGLGETRADRVSFVHTLATLPEHPGSVPINALVQIEGTPLAMAEPVEPIELVRTIAVCRITMPESVVRLSAGREEMSDETQALAFLAGANSIFVGDALLTTPNPEPKSDAALFQKLGLKPAQSSLAQG
ncbi:biotin synthase BioB [Parvularcula sp. ZS-1/3]|uniref:Biotin synthase n=1 Tax=Parvularcula mediterranea TaxID=2732508 RepID=A0A7Y3RKJ0_9PROT|nr:biotin synthase BioB [Parvularcula mediterranea]NNU15764.1 biotin synthase BioB [Parvularcula mediterranea]